MQKCQFIASDYYWSGEVVEVVEVAAEVPGAIHEGMDASVIPEAAM